MKARYALIIAMTAILGMSACNNTGVIAPKESNLPPKAQATIDKYYRDLDISQIEVEKESLGKDDYKVSLSNGTQLEFDSKGDVKEIKAAINNVVPRAFVPDRIFEYLEKNYPGQKVIQIEFDKDETDVTLSTGIELEFDIHGNFMKIDNNSNIL